LPLALEFLQARDSKFKQKIIRLTENSDVFHVSSDDEKHLKGIAIFTTLGAAAKPAIPSLTGILQGKNPFLYDSAMQSLYGIGADSIPSLMEMLTNGNQQGKINAAQCLGYYFGREASNAVPILSQCLNSSDAALRKEAAKSLARIQVNKSVKP
jgi:HEAT repeat protein